MRCYIMIAFGYQCAEFCCSKSINDVQKTQGESNSILNNFLFYEEKFMDSIILDLQNEISSPKCDIVSVLRRAHVIASKLKLEEFDSWISCELNGYSKEAIVPDYRTVKGVIKFFNPYHGWLPVIIPDNRIEKHFNESTLSDSISELINLCERSNQWIIMQYNGETQQYLNKHCDSPSEFQYALHISVSSVLAIIEKVKNAVLEWTLKLEGEGILGENMKFSRDEKSKAQSIPQTINNYYGSTNVINAPADNMQVVAGNNNEITFSYENAQGAVEELEKVVAESQELNEENKEIALEMLSDIKNKIEQKKKPTIIKSVLIGLKEFLIQASASLVAGLVQAKIQGLF